MFCRTGITASQRHRCGQPTIEIVVGNLRGTSRGKNYRLAFVRQRKRVFVTAKHARELKPKHALQEDEGEVTTALVAKLRCSLIISAVAQRMRRDGPTLQSKREILQHRKQFEGVRVLRMQGERPMRVIHM